MLDEQIQADLFSTLSALPAESQKSVLDFAKSLSASSRKKPASTILRFAGIWSEEDAAEISKAIEEEFEQVDERDW